MCQFFSFGTPWASTGEAVIAAIAIASMTNRRNLLIGTPPPLPRVASPGPHRNTPLADVTQCLAGICPRPTAALARDRGSQPRWPTAEEPPRDGPPVVNTTDHLDTVPNVFVDV